MLFEGKNKFILGTVQPIFFIQFLSMVKEFKEIILHTLKVQVLFFVSLANYLEQILLLLQLDFQIGKERVIELHHTSNRQFTNQIH